MMARLVRLEARHPRLGDPSLMSWDELQLAVLDRTRDLAGVDGADPQLLAEASEVTTRIEAELRAAVPVRSTAAYAASIAARAEAWAARKGGEAYVPALLGREDEDLDRPNIMRRRRALWARPDIQAMTRAEAS